jgi:hypothetical protein
MARLAIAERSSLEQDCPVSFAVQGVEQPEPLHAATDDQNVGLDDGPFLPPAMFLCGHDDSLLSGDGRDCTCTTAAKGWSLIPLCTERTFDFPRIDVQRRENLMHFAHGHIILDRPLDDIEVLATLLDLFDDRINQRRQLE